jgi:hypothetical protein
MSSRYRPEADEAEKLCDKNKKEEGKGKAIPVTVRGGP